MFHLIAVEAGPTVQIVRFTIQNGVDIVHVQQGNALFFSVHKDTLVNVVPLTVAVDKKFYRDILGLCCQVFQSEVAQHLGGDRVLTVQIAVKAVGDIQQVELVVHPVQKTAHVINVFALGEDGVREVDQLPAGEAGFLDKVGIFVEESGKLALG